ncbi:MAG: zinc-ribbon domain-containing protein [Methanobacteriota archaeon]|nr:MAG: zinc-ribbon domain-containing protein [Euryarchaeota archaeon]
MAASKVCASCGAVNSPSNVFCIHCGKPLAAAEGPPSPTPYPAAYPPAYPGMPPPGAYPYWGPPPRRATAGSILSAMFDVWTKNFVSFFAVFFTLSLVNGLFGVVLFYAFFGSFGVPTGIFPGLPGAGGSVDLARLAGLAILVGVVGVILNSIVAGGMTEYAVRRYRGEQIDVQAGLRRGLERGLIALYVYIGMSLYAPAIMMENQTAIGGLSRSWQITKGSRWSLFGAILVTAILTTIIGVVITTPAGFAQNLIVSVVAAALVSGIVGGWFLILAAVAYDLIVRAPAPMYGPPPYMPGPMTPPMSGGPPAGPPGSQPPSTPPTGP